MYYIVNGKKQKYIPSSQSSQTTSTLQPSEKKNQINWVILILGIIFGIISVWFLYCFFKKK